MDGRTITSDGLTGLPDDADSPHRLEPWTLDLCLPQAAVGPRQEQESSR